MPAAPSQAAIERAAEAIAAAENPLIISGGIYHSAAFFEALSGLADDFAIAVSENAGGSLPTSHRMNMGGPPREILKESDVIVLLDAAVPWIPRFAEPSAGTTIIQIASDPTFRQLPYRGFRTDIAIAGEPSLALPLLREALAGKLRSKRAVIDARRRRNEEKRARIDAERAKFLQEARAMTPIHPAWTAHCLNQIKDDDAIVINELGLPSDYLDLDRPGCYPSGANAGGLGRGLGEALGAKLAAPGRQVIAAVGDGSYMFCVPTAAHFVGRAEGLPTLTLVSNNAEWFAVRRATTSMYPKGRASTANSLPLVDLAPSPSFEKTIEACDGYGEKVDDPEKLPAALERSFRAIDDGRQALLNIVTRAGGRG
jgi:acetolactate synthase-1/2/3 large subunit